VEKVDISIVEKARLRRISKGLSLDLLVLLKEFEEEYTKLTDAKVEGNRERLAVNAVINKHRREMKKQQYVSKNPPVVIYGFLVGDAGMRDKAEEMREKVKRIIDKEGLQYAQDMQLINGDNEILDQRPHIYGRENPNHLEPLDPKLKLRSRTLFGCLKLNGESKFRYGSIHTEDNRLARAWDQIQFFTPFQTYGLLN